MADDTIVCDNGSGKIKAEFCDAKSPKVVPCIVGKYTMAGPGQDDFCIGDEAYSKWHECELKCPIQHGMISDWDDMERIWNYTFHKKLGIDTGKDHPILLTDSPLNLKSNREKMAEIMFEKFDVPYLCIANTAVLALYANGCTTGIVLDSGNGVTHVVPIYEGKVIRHATQRLDLAGSDVTRFLQKEVEKLTGELIASDEVDTLKEKTTFVSEDYDYDLEYFGDQKVCYLPRTKIHVNLESQIFRCPEILFQPTLIGKQGPGFHEAIHSSIMSCDNHMRKDLYENVILSGGSTLIPGFDNRLRKELRVLAPSTMNVKILSYCEREYTAWFGGALLAKQPELLPRVWMSRNEYEDKGGKYIKTMVENLSI